MTDSKMATEKFRFSLPNEDVVVVYEDPKYGHLFYVVYDKDGNTRKVGKYQ